jgi:general secretion pathway protein E
MKPETVPLPQDALTIGSLRAARTQALAAGQPFIDALARQLGVSPQQAMQLLARQFAMPCMDTAQMLALRADLKSLPLVRAQQRGCALLQELPKEQSTGPSSLAVGVVADPLDVDLMTWIEAQVATPVEFRLASSADIAAYLARLEESARAVDGMLAPSLVAKQAGREMESLTLASASDAASPAVRIVNSALYDALKAGASDIHLESTSSGLSLKLRIDGVLHHSLDVAGIEVAEQSISRLKVMADLDIAERRVPQDGSFRVRTAEREIDLRLSVMPSVHGEDAVIRILDKQAMVAAHGVLTLDALGFDDASLGALRAMVEQPHGMLLVTGPTGSGKTTTLYAAIAETNNGRDKIVTIEDPVEYQLPGVLQIPVNDKKGLTFARGLRSILRHDPDKIMVGEIRDRETAEIAVQSALTGHLVLTTVHANNVYDVFGRFSYMGLDPYAFVSALTGIWAQRLLRVNCARCGIPKAPDGRELERMGLSPQQVQRWALRAGAGCGDCRGTGYRGRKAVAEVLTLNDELRELIVARQPIRLIREAAERHGTRSLRDAALALVARGETTLEEVRRVTLAT